MILNSYNKFTIKKNMPMWFSLCILFIFLFILIWFIYDKHDDYLIQYNKASVIAASNADNAIRTSISTNKRLLDNFALEHHDKIILLIKNPDNNNIYNELYNGLKRQIPELFTINVFTKKGEIIIDDLDGFVGQMCKTDLNKFLISNHHIKRTHPNNVLYHYDEISQVFDGDDKYLFFASFSLDKIAEKLTYSTPVFHELIIVNSSDNNLIEITKTGGRDKQEFRNNFRLTSKELSMVSSSLSIAGTHWSIYDIKNPKNEEKNLRSLIFFSVVVFILISSIIFLMQKILNKNYQLLNKLTHDLTLRNDEITSLNLNLEKLAIKDPLTDMYNRRYFDEYFKREWSRAERRHEKINIIMIDIDYFKKYNDRYGHLKGDDYIKQIANVIQSCFNRNDDFVARFGGEEFIGITVGDEASYLNVSKSIHDKLRSLHIEHIDNVSKFVTVSIGISSVIPTNGISSNELINCADKALYEAKNSGRNRTNVHPFRL